jgi:hypothetical protein
MIHEIQGIKLLLVNFVSLPFGRQCNYIQLLNLSIMTHKITEKTDNHHNKTQHLLFSNSMSFMLSVPILGAMTFNAMTLSIMNFSIISLFAKLSTLVL